MVNKDRIRLEDLMIAMLLASVVGASAGIYYVSILNPLNNYFLFMALFGMVGICVANLVLLALYEAYRWLK